MFFFCCGPFLLVPRVIGLRIFFAVGPGCAKCFFFVALRWAPRPFGGARGPEQKKSKKKNTTQGALAPCRRPTGLLLPLPFLFFFLLRPRADAHSLTAGLGGDASPSPGWCFFFAAAPPGPGWCFVCCGPARTLTHSRWPGAISARPGWCFFFCCGPAGSF